jgi:hypothetical protein
MNTTHLLVLFLAHWVGDFLLQTSEMALNKSRSLKWLTLHVAIYSLVLLLFSALILDWRMIGWFILTNAILHWITDFFTSKLAVKFHNQPKIFYPIIGFDQLIHYSCLTLTLHALPNYF